MRYYDQQYRSGPSSRPPMPRERSRYGNDFDERRLRPRSPRITSAYNRDYTVPRPPPPTFNPNRFGGDVEGRIVDMRSIRGPYITRGGTWTSRGSLNPPRYDLPYYGPDYGGRYPDEF